MSASVINASDNIDNTENTTFQGISSMQFGIMPLNLQLVNNWDVSVNFLYNNAYCENVLNFGQTMTVEAYAKNSTTSSKEIMLFAAAYTTDGRLSEIYQNGDTITNNEIYQQISVNVPLPSANTAEYKSKGFCLGRRFVKALC
jgi:RecG-like helicase